MRLRKVLYVYDSVVSFTTWIALFSLPLEGGFWWVTGRLGATVPAVYPMLITLALATVTLFGSLAGGLRFPDQGDT